MNNHLSNALKGAHFHSMPAIPYDILFKRQSMKNDCYIEDKMYRAPFALVKCAFFPDLKRIEYKKTPSAKILFYMSDPNRKSNEINFFKVVNTVDNPDYIIERHGKPAFSWLGFYLFLILTPIWFFQLRGRNLIVLEKYQIIKQLINVYRVKVFFEKIDIRRYHLLVCYYDSILHECMLNLMFQNESVKTATLQHGQFNAWRENTYVNCGLELLSSPSNYMLCWNKLAREESIKSGWAKENTPVLGILSNIGRGRVRCQSNNNGIFGVVLCHPSWHQDNLDMIEAANYLARVTDKKYYLKLHPNYDNQAFMNNIDKQYCLGIVEKGLDLLQYANMVDFSIVGSTSVYVELVYLYHDIIRYSTGLPSDKYLSVSLGNVFHDPSEIISCYQKMSSGDKDTLFDYLCESEETDMLYKSFFEKFC